MNADTIKLASLNNTCHKLRQFTVDLGFTQFIFEGDFEFVIKALFVGNFSLSWVQDILLDTKVYYEFVMNSFILLC